MDPIKIMALHGVDVLDWDFAVVPKTFLRNHTATKAGALSASVDKGAILVNWYLDCGS